MSKQSLTLSLPTSSYDIVVESGALKKASEYLDLDRKVLVVTDAGVPPKYADTVLAQCKDGYRIVLSGGEGCKNLDSFSHLLEVMLKADFTRRDCVIAVGGGVVGDVAAFAASAYMRGIDFYNLPTTLLSQLDSSIGGKTGVNFCGVKNIVGSFYQPKKVLIDPDTLQTLDARLFNEGLAEAIKMAATCDADLFSLLEQDAIDIETLIVRALQIKKRVVEEDEKEHGLRRVLNFGHTLGHAIESVSGGNLYHGECVALGMLPMASFAARTRLKALLEQRHLPTEIPFTQAQLRPALLHDKKRECDKISAVIVNEIGSFEIQSLSPDTLLSRLEEIL